MDYINQETGTKDFGNGYVANLSIYSYNGISSSSTYFTGHAFLTIQNLTKDFLTIGKMNVEPYDTISIGTWPKKLILDYGIILNHIFLKIMNL